MSLPYELRHAIDYTKLVERLNIIVYSFPPNGATLNIERTTVLEEEDHRLKCRGIGERIPCHVLDTSADNILRDFPNSPLLLL